MWQEAYQMVELLLSLIAGVVFSALVPKVMKMIREMKMMREEQRRAPARGKIKFEWPLRREETVDALFNVLLFVAMLGGIAANYFYVHGVVARVDLNQLWKPVLISPIIFMPVYATVTKHPRGLIPILVAFQNGFFWQTIFERAGPITAA